MKLSLNLNWNAIAMDWAFLEYEHLEKYLESIAEEVKEHGFAKLDGVIRNGKPHGTVTLFMVGGIVQFWCEDGVPARQMKILFTQSYVFEGIVPCGEGTLTFPNGHRYEGSMYHCRPHGEGIFYVKDGGYVKGIWKNGCMDGLMTVVDVDGNQSEIDATE
ncbi:hypothetical protein [Paenibacillus sp. FJAT-27812]|uniref:hypothetical protein n=1 Tax=Paenibacillus sp. FJAT-27812 TaxID=1684143 RepID=UPI0006A764D2|nr:hypothetical protein [Paenibacillus sp. FJAT-27812]